MFSNTKFLHFLLKKDLTYPSSYDNSADEISKQLEQRRSEMIQVSTSIVSDAHIEVVANLISYIVSNHLEEEKAKTLVQDFRTSSIKSPPYDPQITTHEKLHLKIVKFFKFVRNLVGLTTAELAHALNLIC